MVETKRAKAKLLPWKSIFQGSQETLRDMKVLLRAKKSDENAGEDFCLIRQEVSLHPMEALRKSPP